MTDGIVKGGCFCGAVAFEAEGPAQRMLDCFCTDCQHFTGGGPAHLYGVAGRGFRFTRGVPRNFSHRGGSGQPVERLFCGDCGAPVAARPAKLADIVFIIASALDDPSMFRPEAAIWTGLARSWHHVPDGIPTFEKGRTA